MPVRPNVMLLSLCLSAALVSASCGGGSPDAAEDKPVTDTPSDLPLLAGDLPAENASVASTSCSALPAIPAKPAHVRSVTEFGVQPNDSADHTDAIQRALNSLAPGEWLVFPPGRYTHSKSLHMKVANTVMWGDGVTLHATNPSDQAIWIEADGASIYKFTLTAITNTRRTTPWESRIAVFGGTNPLRLLSGNVVRGNKVLWGGNPGTPLQNSASSAGIFIYHATGFLVAENTVSRTLADGIHVTAGSSYGRVINNYVKETGDDMIAVVSYIGDPSTSAATVAANFTNLRSSQMNHHITISGNMVSGQYWGRGISVVGGENVTIENNSIDKTTHAAGVYLARETSYLTFGVRNVIVRNNTITDVQTTIPAYTAGTVSPNAPKTGHGAVEIYSFVFSDEAANSSLNAALAVQNILVESNTLNRVKYDGVRIGTGWGKTSTFTGKRSDGSLYTRSYTGGVVGLIGLTSNKMSAIGGQAIAINNRPTAQNNVSCSGNTDDGGAGSNGLCSGGVPVVAPACP
jgi:hypothetical protein